MSELWTNLPAKFPTRGKRSRVPDHGTQAGGAADARETNHVQDDYAKKRRTSHAAIAYLDGYWLGT